MGLEGTRRERERESERERERGGKEERSSERASESLTSEGGSTNEEARNRVGASVSATGVIAGSVNGSGTVTAAGRPVDGERRVARVILARYGVSIPSWRLLSIVLAFVRDATRRACRTRVSQSVHSGVPRPAGIDPSLHVKPFGGLAVSDTLSEEGESLFRSPVMCASSYS